MSNLLSVGIIAAPRSVMYLSQSLESYFHEWQISPCVFAEPGTPSFMYECRVTRYDNTQRLGGVRNWLRAAKYLIANSDSPFIMICEDDILWTEGAADKIVGLLNFFVGKVDLLVKPPELSTVGLISPYCAKINEPEDRGWRHPRIRSTGFCGALCTIYPRRSLEDILQASDYLLEQAIGKTGEVYLLDYAIGRTVQHLNKVFYTHKPTLVQHLGEVSTFPQNNTAAAAEHKTRQQSI